MSCQSQTLKYPFSGPYPFFGIIHPLFFHCRSSAPGGVAKKISEREHEYERGGKKWEMGTGEEMRVVISNLPFLLANPNYNLWVAAYASQYTI
jgi:hypothetical protein